MVKSPMPQLRLVETPDGPISYTLTRKPVKNLNLRINRGGEIFVSIPARCPVKAADDFLREKSKWIIQARNRQEERQVNPLPPVSHEVCARNLYESVARVYPMVESYGVTFPAVKLRRMKSQWGNCHWKQGYITMNTALARCPEELRDYVALHELVHFLHHDHGPGFYARMDTLMPDWRQRRRALKEYGQVLEDVE